MLRKMLPAPIKNVARRLINKPEFTGDFPSWPAAVEAAEGFDLPQIVEKIRAATLNVKQGNIAFERDSVSFHREEFRWPLLAALLHVATTVGMNLHIVDFGGSLGSFYFQHKKFLDDVKGLKWSIVEQPEYVKIGQREFEDETLRFFHTLEQCAERAKIDVVLFSGSLQFLEDPFYFLTRAAALSNCVVIDRTALIERKTDRITIQSPPRSIYGGSHPYRFLSGGNFDRRMSELGLVLLAEWPGFEHRANIKCEYVGRIYVKKQSG